MSETHGLPRFGKPPVVETVLGVYFRPSEKFALAQIGMVWDRCFREQFPKLDERPPAEEVIEQFGDARQIAFPMLRWQVMDRPETPRLWAQSQNGQHVVQIQRNAFFANWLKTADDVGYRSFDDRRQEFDRQLTQLDKFFHDFNIGEFEPTSWNVTYINHIEFKGLEKVGPDVAQKLTVWTNQFSDGFLHDPDNLTLNFAFPIPDNAGRLNVNVTPVVLPKEKRQALRLDLAARGQLKNTDIPGAMSAIDLGHEWVVRGFASLTRPEMHQFWEREQ